MNFLDFPTEIIQEILIHSIRIRGLERGMRLRLINRRLSSEVEEALLSTRMLDDEQPVNTRIWRYYFSYRVLSDPHSQSPLLDIIRTTAKFLCEKKGLVGGESYEESVNGLCCYLLDVRSFCIGKISNRVIPNPEYWTEEKMDFRKHLLGPATYMNCVPLIRRLIEEGEDPSQDSWFWGCPIYIAAYQGNHELLELFLSDTSPGNFIVKKARAVQGANRASRLSTLNLVLQPSWGHILPTHGYLIRALKSCQWNKDAKIVRRMAEELAPHTSCHNPGGLPLNNLGALITQAAMYGYLDQVQNLLSINAPVDELHDEHKNMPLLSACEGGHYEIVKLLLESGANPNPANAWETPLQAAAKHGYLRISKLLLDHGADIDQGPSASNKGTPAPVVSSIKLEYTAMFHLLRERGAIVSSPETGAVAMNACVEMGLDSMVELLLQNGVKACENNVVLATQLRHGEILRMIRPVQGEAKLDN